MYVLCLTFNDLSHVRVHLSEEWCVHVYAHMYILYTKRYTLSLHWMARADQVRGHKDSRLLHGIVCSELP